MSKKGLLLEYLLVMVLLIALNFTFLKAIAILIPILYMILESKFRKRTKQENGFNLKATLDDMKQNWHLMLLMTVILPLITVFFAKTFAPEYFEHLINRVAPYVDLNDVNKMLTQLLIFAFGEEIAFRAFLQGRLSWFIKPKYAVIVSSLVFSIVHFTPGIAIIVFLDLLSVFLDGLVLGIIFKRSNNVIVTTITHFIGNSISLFILIGISTNLL